MSSFCHLELLDVSCWTNRGRYPIPLTYRIYVQKCLLPYFIILLYSCFSFLYIWTHSGSRLLLPLIIETLWKYFSIYLHHYNASYQCLKSQRTPPRERERIMHINLLLLLLLRTIMVSRRVRGRQRKTRSWLITSRNTAMADGEPFPRMQVLTSPVRVTKYYT